MKPRRWEIQNKENQENSMRDSLECGFGDPGGLLLEGHITPAFVIDGMGL